MRCDADAAQALAAAVVCFAVRLAEPSMYTTISGYRAVYAPPMAPSVLELDVTKVTCVAMCSTAPNCSIANYDPASRTCEMLQGAGQLLQQEPGSQLLFQVDSVDDSDELEPYQALPGVLLVGAQQERPAHYNVTGVLNGRHCLRLCLTLLPSCSVFSYNAKTRECVISTSDFYDDWSVADASVADWTGYYRSSQGSWKLLLKASNGIGVNVASLFYDGVSYNGSVSANETALDSSCGCYVKSQILNNWSRFPIRKIKMAYASGGRLLKFIDFRAKSTTQASFFAKINIDNSSWSDLNYRTIMFCASTGTDLLNMYFYAMLNATRGWMTVGSAPGAVQPSVTRPVPQFAYSQSSTMDSMSNAQYADAMLIYAQL